MAYMVNLHIDGNDRDDNNEHMYLAGSSAYEILSNGIFSDGNFLWTYKGSGTFLGFALTQNASAPEPIFTVGYKGVGSDIAKLTGYAETVYLYSVVSSSPTITDLTGTVWYFNEVLEQVQESFSYNINFTSNNTSYIKISWLYSSTPRTSMGLRYSPDANSNTNVYNDGVIVDFDYWDNLETYRTISITGGNDVTNSDLISWLQANATLLSIPTSPSYSAADPLVIRYKGEIIYSTSSTSPITLAVSGKYLEDDITVTLNPPFAEQNSNTLNILGAYSTTKSGTILTLT